MRPFAVRPVSLCTGLLSLVLIASLGMPVTAAGDVTGIKMRLPSQDGTIVSGTVTRASGGAPIENAAAMLVNPVEGWILIARYPTDADGRFRMIVPEWAWTPGDYVLRIETEQQPGLPDGYYAAGAPGRFVAEQADASVLTVGADDVTGLDVAVPVGGGIRGRVTRASDDAPLSDVDVQLSLGDQYVAETYTSETGVYRFRGLGAAGYQVRVRPSDDTGLQSGCYRTGAPGGFTAECGHATAVDVDGAIVDGIDVALPKGIVVRGRVTTASGAAICPTVEAIPEEETPAAVPLRIRQSDDPAFRRGQAISRGVRRASPADFWGGCFPLRGLSPGRYRFFIWSDYDPQGSTNIVRGYYSSSNGKHWVRDGGTVVDLTANLDLGTIVPDTGRTITGTLRDLAGDPLRRFDVQTTDGKGRWAGGQASTDRKGRFRLASLSPGQVRLYASDQQRRGFQCAWYRADVPRQTTLSRRSSTLLSLGPSVSGISMRLSKQTYDVAGRILDANGDPISGFIILEPVGGSLPSDCAYGFGGPGQDGRFTVENVMPGRYRLLVVVFDPRFASGWYRAGAPGGFTDDADLATVLRVGP